MYVKSSCKYLREDRLGAWVTILEYRGNKKILKGNGKDTTDKRMLWTGIIEGLKQLKEPCLINIYTIGALGLKSSTNKDLREIFLKEIEINKHEFKSIITNEYDYKLSKIVSEYYRSLN
jgi:ribonuclease HI